MEKRYLLMWLESPLQSWGADSKFGRRDTLNFPTKSGILGLICSALGRGGEQQEFLSRFISLSQTIISFVRTKQFGSEIIKCERELLLRDFHMVGSGYNDENPWQKLLVPKTSEGKKAVGGGTKLTYRYYLQDAYFAAILEVPVDIVEDIATALKNPIWDLYFGRKCCVPTDFIFRGVFSTQLEAVSVAKKISQEKNLVEDFRVIDGEHEGEVVVINDVPLQFGQNKLYRDRLVTVVVS